MLLRIAWRNIWRHRSRSLVLMTAIALGMLAGVFTLGFSWGLSKQRMDNMINKVLSHVQLHTPAFKEDASVKSYIPRGIAIKDSLKRQPGVAAAAARLLLNGMLSVAGGSYGAQIHGIDPADEAALTGLDKMIVAGAYFEGEGRIPQVLIGAKLAEKLGMKTESGWKMRKDVVLSFQALNDTANSLRFRVAGIYVHHDARYEEFNLFVRREALAEAIDPKGDAAGMAHEVALRLQDPEQIVAARDQLAANYASLKAEEWRELAPDLRLMTESFRMTVYILMTIILLALAFGIVNTMLMAVLERTRELGVMMAVGMNKRRLFIMIVLETLMLALGGAAAGMLAGWLLNGWFGKRGLDLAAVSMDFGYGFDSKVYNQLDGHYYWEIAALVLLVTLVAAIWPARRALALKPVEAIRAL